MKQIDTATKNWQKEMEAAMNKGEKFILLTEDERLANGLVEKTLRTGILKIILLGSSGIVAGGTGVVGLSGTGVVGLSGIAGVGAVSSLAAVADPEPVSKIVLAIVAAICFALGAYFVYRLVKMLLNKKYKFTIDVGAFGQKIKVVAEPA